MAKIFTNKGIPFDVVINEEIANRKVIFVVHCLDFEVTSQGKTIEEAMENIKDAVSLYLQECPKEAQTLKIIQTAKTISPFATRLFL